MNSDTIVSFSPSIRQVKMTRRSLGDIFAMMHSNKMADRVGKLRKIEEKDARTAYKAGNLPWFSLGIFADDDCRDENLIESYGTVLDIDDCDTSATMDALRQEPLVFAAFISPSGNGVKAIVPWDAPVSSVDEYRERWAMVADYFEFRHDIKIDNCPDPRRACFLSHDPSMFINTAAAGFPATTAPTEYEPFSDERDTDEIMSACQYLNGRLGYHDWARAGLAIAGECGASGESYFLALSLNLEQYPRDTRQKLKRRYARHCADARGRSNLNTLFFLANREGWTPPKRKREKQRSGKSPIFVTSAESANNTNHAQTVREPNATKLTATAAEAPMTEAAIANLWIQRNGADWRFCHSNDMWYRWTGKFWQIDTKKQVVQTMLDMAEFMAGRDQSSAMRKAGLSMQSIRRISSVLKLAATNDAVGVEITEFEQQHELITCQNGVVNLRTGELLPFDQKYMFTRIIDARLDPNADAAFFPTFADATIVDGSGRQDVEMVDYLQRACGYTLTGVTGGQCLFMFHGEGHNGKSQWINMLVRLMGDYAHVLKPKVILRGGDNSDHSIAALVGIRMAAIGELQQHCKLDEAAVKTLTGGDVLEANPKYIAPFKFRATHKCWTLGNHRPQIEGTDEGIWRRIRLILMQAHIPREDMIPQEDLQEMLWADRDFIFTWMVKGAVKYFRDKIEPPKSMIDAVRVYRLSEDIVGRFIDECFEPGVQMGRHIPAMLVYRQYENWCKGSHEKIEKKRWFYDNMRKHGVRIEKTTEGNETLPGNQLYVQNRRINKTMADATNDDWWNK